jgi:hypothetical protein
MSLPLSALESFLLRHCVSYPTPGIKYAADAAALQIDAAAFAFEDIESCFVRASPEYIDRIKYTLQSSARQWALRHDFMDDMLDQARKQFEDECADAESSEAEPAPNSAEIEFGAPAFAQLRPIIDELINWKQAFDDEFWSLYETRYTGKSK